MKLTWFHLLPHAELTDNDNRKHPPVRIDIRSSLFNLQHAHRMYSDSMGGLAYAADRGFDAVCIDEHYANGYRLLPLPDLIASAPARRAPSGQWATPGGRSGSA